MFNKKSKKGAKKMEMGTMLEESLPGMEEGNHNQPIPNQVEEDEENLILEDRQNQIQLKKKKQIKNNVFGIDGSTSHLDTSQFQHTLEGGEIYLQKLKGKLSNPNEIDEYNKNLELQTNSIGKDLIFEEEDEVVLQNSLAEFKENSGIENELEPMRAKPQNGSSNGKMANPMFKIMTDKTTSGNSINSLPVYRTIERDQNEDKKVPDDPEITDDMRRELMKVELQNRKFEKEMEEYKESVRIHTSGDDISMLDVNKARVSMDIETKPAAAIDEEDMMNMQETKEFEEIEANILKNAHHRRKLQGSVSLVQDQVEHLKRLKHEESLEQAVAETKFDDVLKSIENNEKRLGSILKERKQEVESMERQSANVEKQLEEAIQNQANFEQNKSRIFRLMEKVKEMKDLTDSKSKMQLNAVKAFEGELQRVKHDLRNEWKTRYLELQRGNHSLEGLVESPDLEVLGQLFQTLLTSNPEVETQTGSEGLGEKWTSWIKKATEQRYEGSVRSLEHHREEVHLMVEGVQQILEDVLDEYLDAQLAVEMSLELCKVYQSEISNPNNPIAKSRMRSALCWYLVFLANFNFFIYNPFRAKFLPEVEVDTFENLDVLKVLQVEMTLLKERQSSSNLSSNFEGTNNGGAKARKLQEIADENKRRQDHLELINEEVISQAVVPFLLKFVGPFLDPFNPHLASLVSNEILTFIRLIYTNTTSKTDSSLLEVRKILDMSQKIFLEACFFIGSYSELLMFLESLAHFEKVLQNSSMRTIIFKSLFECWFDKLLAGEQRGLQNELKGAVWRISKLELFKDEHFRQLLQNKLDRFGVTL